MFRKWNLDTSLCPFIRPAPPFPRRSKKTWSRWFFLDEIGFREAWIGEHFTAGWENIPAPDLFIAKAAALTERIIFGTGVSCLPQHDPFMLAHRIAVLDHLLKGRFYWGVGSREFHRRL